LYIQVDTTCSRLTYELSSKISAFVGALNVGLYIQYTYIVRKYITYLYELESKFILTTMYVYCVYLAIFKKKYKTPAKTVTVLSVALHESGNINTLLGP